MLCTLSQRNGFHRVHKYLKSSVHCFCQLKVQVTLSCLTLCDPMRCIVHGILQARIMEWVAFPFSRVSSQPRDWTQVSHIADRFFISWATREAQEYWRPIPSPGDLPNPGIEPVLLHCRWILYQLSYQGSPVRNTQAFTLFSPPNNWWIY